MDSATEEQNSKACAEGILKAILNWWGLPWPWTGKSVHAREILHVHEGVAGGHMKGSLKLYILKGRTQSFLLPLVSVFSLMLLFLPSEER